MVCGGRKRTDSWDPESPRVSSLELDMEWDQLEERKQSKRSICSKRIYFLHGMRVW